MTTEMTSWEMTSVVQVPQVAGEILTLVRQRQDGGAAAVLALHGDLGAGKTTLTQELARQLGVTEMVVSPTFVVMKGYETTDEQLSQLIHIDAYRIEDIDEMRVMHFGELLASTETILVIEWAERIDALLPKTTVHLDLTTTNETHLITLRNA